MVAITFFARNNYTADIAARLERFMKIATTAYAPSYFSLRYAETNEGRMRLRSNLLLGGPREVLENENMMYRYRETLKRSDFDSRVRPINVLMNLILASHAR